MNQSRQFTLKRAKLLPMKTRPADTMTPEEIVEKFSDMLKKFEAMDGQLSDTILMQIREVLATLLLQIPYDETKITYNMIGLIHTVAAYTTRYGVVFIEPARVGAYNARINDDITDIVRAHRSGTQDQAFQPRHLQDSAAQYCAVYPCHNQGYGGERTQGPRNVLHICRTKGAPLTPLRRVHDLPHPQTPGIV